MLKPSRLRNASPGQYQPRAWQEPEFNLEDSSEEFNEETVIYEHGISRGTSNALDTLQGQGYVLAVSLSAAPPPPHPQSPHHPHGFLISFRSWLSCYLFKWALWLLLLIIPFLLPHLTFYSTQYHLIFLYASTPRIWAEIFVCFVHCYNPSAKIPIWSKEESNLLNWLNTNFTY